MICLEYAKFRCLAFRHLEGKTGNQKFFKHVLKLLALSFVITHVWHACEQMFRSCLGYKFVLTWKHGFAWLCLNLKWDKRKRNIVLIERPSSELFYLRLCMDWKLYYIVINYIPALMSEFLPFSWCEKVVASTLICLQSWYFKTSVGNVVRNRCMWIENEYCKMQEGLKQGINFYRWNRS